MERNGGGRGPGYADVYDLHDGKQCEEKRERVGKSVGLVVLVYRLWSRYLVITYVLARPPTHAPPPFMAAVPHSAVLVRCPPRLLTAAT